MSGRLLTSTFPEIGRSRPVSFVAPSGTGLQGLIPRCGAGVVQEELCGQVEPDLAEGMIAVVRSLV
jgi:hypothetical protein